MQLNEKLYALALAAANVGTWHWNVVTNEVAWSDNIEGLFGIGKGEFDGSFESFIALLPAPDKQMLLDAVDLSFKDDRPYEIEHRIIWRNGETHWYLAKGSVVRDSTGSPIEMMGTTQDITARKQTEQALSESEARFRTALNAMAAGVVVQDRSDRILSCNPAAEQILGLTQDQLMGLSSFDPRWHAVHEDGTPFDPQQHPSVMTLRSGKPQQNVMMGINKPDGTLTWISINSQPLFNLGDELPYGVVVSFHDLTARKQADEKLHTSENRLRQAINIAQLGIWDWDIASDTTVWQGKMFDIYGIQPDQFTGKGADYIAFTRADYRAKQVENIKGVFEHGLTEEQLLKGVDVPNTPKELCIVRPDGSEVYTLGDAVAIIDNTGKPLRLLGVTMDISERKRAEAALHELNAALEQRVHERTMQLQDAVKELEAFSYSISHDLRAPLRAIDGFARALNEDFSHHINDVGQDYLKRIRHGAQRMGVLIDDLLNLSRVGRAALNATNVDVSAIANEIVAQLRATSPEREISVDISAGIIAHGDARLLHVVLTNLLDNAWKYTSKTEHAHISFGQKRIGDQRVYFVRDNGTGFDMRHVGKLFGAFQRLHSEQEFPGTGIGLATVARIIHRHDGKVWAESKLNEGATFYFTLGASNQS